MPIHILIKAIDIINYLGNALVRLRKYDDALVIFDYALE